MSACGRLVEAVALGICGHLAPIATFDDHDAVPQVRCGHARQV